MTVADSAVTFSPAARASTMAGVFDGRLTAAFAERGTATAADAIKTGTAMAGIHFNQVRFMVAKLLCDAYSSLDYSIRSVTGQRA